MGYITYIYLIYPSYKSGKGLLYILPDVGITSVRIRGDYKNGIIT